MGWKQELVSETKTLQLEVLLKKESFWYSDYNEPERWIRDMKDCYCTLVGEYQVGREEKNLWLYRFELDESHRKDFAPNVSHYHNVIINKDKPQVALSFVAPTDKKKK